MLRGTVYVVDENGVPLSRGIISTPAHISVLEFKNEVARRAAESPTWIGKRLEFGPIGESWGK